MKLIRRQFLLILLTMLVLVLLWEFWLEDIFWFSLPGQAVKSEDFRERLECVLTVMLFSGLSLAYPFFQAVRSENARRRAEQEREQLIRGLQASMAEIKTLRGIIPICSYCKKIRNDEDSWTQLEAYLDQHSEASFSHGICPECAERVTSELRQGG